MAAWINEKESPAILAGHTYFGMADQFKKPNADLWVTMREPAARLNSGLLRFHRIPLKSSNSQGGYIGNTKGHSFSTASEIEEFAKSEMSHELNGMCRRIAGYSLLSSAHQIEATDDLESCRF